MPTPTTSRVQLALYRGPGTTLAHKLAHIITVVVLTVRSGAWSPHSHAELVIDGVCHSSSARDGGVRAKQIDLSTGRWDVWDMPGASANNALAVFKKREGLGYDWPGALRWGLPFLRQRPRADYCFECVAHMLGLHHPSKVLPLDLTAWADYLGRKLTHGQLVALQASWSTGKNNQGEQIA